MEDYAVSDPDRHIETTRDELEMQGVWEMYKKYYDVDPDVAFDTVLHIHMDNAARIGLL